MHRRALLTGLSACLPLMARPSLAADAPDVIGFTPDPAFLEKALRVLAAAPSLDAHAHPGRTFSRSDTGAAAGLSSFEDRTVADMRSGLLGAGSFAAVADASVLAVTPTGISVRRDFQPGEAFALYRHQMADLHAVVAENKLRLIRKVSDIDACKPGRDLGAILTVEGGDFLEGSPERLRAARDEDDVRIITLVHYRLNELADNQTSPAKHGGLSLAGKAVVMEMARLGIVIDVAHAAETSVRQVLEAVSTPILCSHTHVKTTAVDHPRFITPDTARAIAKAGGVIGSWPAGIGGSTLNDYVDRIFALAEVVGTGHISLGTDMDANYRPIMSSYRQLPLVVSELLRRGYGGENVSAFLHGNLRRVFAANWGRIAA